MIFLILPVRKAGDGHGRRPGTSCRCRRARSAKTSSFSRRQPQVAGLAVGPGADRLVPLSELDRLGPIGIGRALDRLDEVGDVSAGDRLLAAVGEPKLLEDLAREFDPVGVALDADLAVAGDHL